MKKQRFLKSNLWLVIALFAITYTMTSCSDDDSSDEVSDTVIITVDDAAELVAFSIANRTYGLVDNLDYVVDEVLELIDCNESQSTVRTESEVSNDGKITVMYTISENYSQTCGSEEVVTYSFNIEQVVMSERYDTDQIINGSWTIRGVQDGSTQLTYDGPYSRSGTWTYNQEDNHTDNVTYTSVLNNVTADPETGRITSGTATFSLNGTSTVYEPFSYEGDIEFLGSDLSIITFGTGEQYELNLETGQITPI